MTFVNRGGPMLLAATLMLWLVVVSVPALREGVPWIWPLTVVAFQAALWALKWLDTLVSPLLFWGIILGEIGLACYCAYLSMIAPDTYSQWANAARFFGLGLLVFVELALFWGSYGGLGVLPGYGNVLGLLVGIFLILMVHNREEWFPDG